MTTQNETAKDVDPQPKSAAGSGENATKRPPIRFWPAVIIVVVGWIGAVVGGVAVDLGGSNAVLMIAGFASPFLIALLLGLWWLFASRARWRDRLLLTAWMIVLAVVTGLVIDRGLLWGYYLFAVPAAASLVVLWWAASGWLPTRTRRAGVALVPVLAFAIWLVLRSDGARGSALPTYAWRWSPTAEERFLAVRASEIRKQPKKAVRSPLPETAEWPGFRGPRRDGIVSSASLAPDWREKAPTMVWKKAVGPAWSSVAVAGDLLYTQEQHGESEAVVCYSVKDGAELWRHLDPSRFEESASGPGPRATPTYHAGRLYTFGASGILNCLDAGDGRRIWRRDIAREHNIEAPTWGFCSSPLVVGDLVYVLGGGKDKALLAYRLDSGKLAWSAGDGALGYSSAQLVERGGERLVLVLNQAGLGAYDAVTGEVKWSEEISTNDQMTLQPQAVGDDLLVGLGSMVGLRKYRIEDSGEKEKLSAQWTAKRLRPSFNDIVVCGSRAIGIDGAILACVDLESGKLIWKGGRYGRGQLLLAGDRLLVQAETGELALVDATADKHVELGRVSALDGKTWNHPALVGNRLFVRNGEEMARFDLP